MQLLEQVCHVSKEENHQHDYEYDAENISGIQIHIHVSECEEEAASSEDRSFINKLLELVFLFQQYSRIEDHFHLYS